MKSCHDDEDMRHEVESLLTSHERAENFIEVPAFKVAPEFVPNDNTDALIGKLIGHYRIESLIGVGGMGKVVSGAGRATRAESRSQASPRRPNNR